MNIRRKREKRNEENCDSGVQTGAIGCSDFPDNILTPKGEDETSVQKKSFQKGTFWFMR
jgi:hypothetical protein